MDTTKDFLFVSFFRLPHTSSAEKVMNFSYTDLFLTSFSPRRNVTRTTWIMKLFEDPVLFLQLFLLTWFKNWWLTSKIYLTAKLTTWMLSVLLASTYMIMILLVKALQIIKHGFAIISWFVSYDVASRYDACYIFEEHERSVKKISLWPLCTPSKTFTDNYGNHSLGITTIVSTTIALIDFISIMWKPVIASSIPAMDSYM